MKKPIIIAAIGAAGAGVALTGSAAATGCYGKCTTTTTTAKPTTTTSTTVPDETTTTVVETTTTTSTTVAPTTSTTVAPTTTVPTDIGTPLAVTREQAPVVVADAAPISYTG